MTPYYEDTRSGITIYHGDCRDVLPRIEANILVTDPPYGHGERWRGGTWGAAKMYRDAERWDSKTIDNDWLVSTVAHFTAAIVWGGNYYALPPSRCWLAWLKSSLMPTMADFELAWTSMDRPSKRFVEDRNPDGKREHPTQKPLSLMSWCLSFVPDGTILDPFMGSGTTLVAAKNLGRRAIGIEIEERYCEIAARRLAQETIFEPIEPTDKPEQETIFQRGYDHQTKCWTLRASEP